jgi:hypothetical protein
MDPLVLAYLAGVIDSDGTIGIKRSTYAMRVRGDAGSPMYSERIHIRQVERAALDLFAATFGGSVTTARASTPNGRPLFVWGQTDRKAARALDALLPYLRIKRTQAENCLALRAVKVESASARVAVGRGHVGSAPRPTALTDAMEALY